MGCAASQALVTMDGLAQEEDPRVREFEVQIAETMRRYEEALQPLREQLDKLGDTYRLSLIHISEPTRPY